MTMRTRPSTYAAVVATETRLWLREPMAVIWVLLFPGLLLSILGLVPVLREPLPEAGGRSIVAVYVPILVAAGMAMSGLYILPAALASYRERGYLRRLSTTPVGATPLLASQLAVNAAAVVVASAACLLVGRLAYGVPLPRSAGAFVLVALLALVALMGIGLVLAATLRSSRTVSTVGTILFFPLMFFAGLWTPLGGLPRTLELVAEASPLGAAVRAMDAATQGSWPETSHLVALVVWAAGTTVAARLLFRWG